MVVRAYKCLILGTIRILTEQKALLDTDWQDTGPLKEGLQGESTSIIGIQSNFT